MKRKILSAAAVSAALLLSACANTDIYGGNVYRGDQAKAARSIAYGTIVSVRPVKIQAESSGTLGSMGGGLIGGIAGSGVGGGRGSAIMSVVGAMVGSAIGSTIEQKANLTNSLEMVIRRDNGTEMVVVQKQEAGFVPGRRVRIVGSGADVNVSLM